MDPNELTTAVTIKMEEYVELVKKATLYDEAARAEDMQAFNDIMSKIGVKNEKKSD